MLSGGCGNLHRAASILKIVELSATGISQVISLITVPFECQYNGMLLSHPNIRMQLMKAIK
jgi:hypothetical protein